MISTCRAQPTAQSSTRWSPSARPPRPSGQPSRSGPGAGGSGRWRRAAGPGSGRRLPGRARAWFSVVRDSGNWPASVRHCARVQCRSTRRSGSTVGRARAGPPVPPRPRHPPGTGPRRAGTPGRRARMSPPGTAPRRGREVPRPPGAPGRPAAVRCDPASAGSTSSIGSAVRPTRGPRAAAAGRPGRPRAGLGQRASRLAVPGGPHRSRYLLVEGGADQRVPEPQPAAGLGQHAGGPGLVHGRDQVRDAPAEHGGQVWHREVHAEQGGGPQDLPHPGGHEAEPVGDGRGQGAGRAVAGELRRPVRRRSGWSCGPARRPAR